MKDPIIVAGLSDEPLDVPRLVDEIRRPDCGGLVVFEGTTRSPNEGVEVQRLDYEAYEERAVAQLQAIAEEIAELHGCGGVVAVHRIGSVAVGQPSVVAAASAPHRDEAFAAARALIDRIKDEVYVWKKEITASGEHWVGVPSDPGEEARSAPADTTHATGQG